MEEPEAIINAGEALASLPAPWPDDSLRQWIRGQVERADTAIVVVDDDPTGTQTVFDVPVLTVWDTDSLLRQLRDNDPLFYILTNSRALPPEDAIALAQDLGHNLAAAARQTQRRLSIVSRSDSTLRGHYPHELDALAQALRLEPDAVLIAPYFGEGGRYTLNDIHYVQEGQRLVPAAQTEFARDPVFGYSHSNLRRWVEEKTGGRWPASQVATLPLDLIRTAGPDALEAKLTSLDRGRPVILNAACDRDLEVVVTAMLRAEAQGKTFLSRTAASFVKIRGGIPDHGLLSPEVLLSEGTGSGGGLVVVGSYVPRTTRQLQRLLALPGWVPIELPVTDVLDPSCRSRMLARIGRTLSANLQAGVNVALFTSRELVTGTDPRQSLRISQQVSAALVHLVQELEQHPRFLVAKGGITSSDVATQGLQVRRALVLGQIAQGVPVWKLGPESRFPGLVYAIFPGNVGTDDTLADIARALARAA